MRNDRWSTAEEIKRILVQADQNSGESGATLYYEKKKNYVQISEGHTLFLGQSGTGKSCSGTVLLAKNLIQEKQNIFVIDPKGEIYSKTYSDLEKFAYNKKVVDFRNIFQSDAFNPLATPYHYFSSEAPEDQEIAMNMINDLAAAFYPIPDSGDPFWQQSARSLFIGAVHALMLLKKENPEIPVNLASAHQLIAGGEQRLGGISCLRELIQTLPLNSVASMRLQSYASTAKDTAAGIKSSFLEGISMCAQSEGIKNLLGYDDIKIHELDVGRPTAIYVILPDESNIFGPLSAILCSQVVGQYLRLAQDQYHGKLPRTVNVILEELGNIGAALPQLANWMTASRSRNMRFYLVLQSLSQLETLYGKSRADTILDNASTIAAFRVSNWETLEELSKKCGRRRLKSMLGTENLITPSQLGAMRTGQALVMIQGQIKYITQLPHFSEIYPNENSPASTQPQNRKLRKPIEIFDLKAFVSEKKKQRLEELMAQVDDDDDDDAIISF